MKIPDAVGRCISLMLVTPTTGVVKLDKVKLFAWSMGKTIVRNRTQPGRLAVLYWRHTALDGRKVHRIDTRFVNNNFKPITRRCCAERGYPAEPPLVIV